MTFPEWLEKIGLAKHASIFAERGINLDNVIRLTDGDLNSLGLDPIDRKALTSAIANLRQQPVVADRIHPDVAFKIASPAFRTQPIVERRQLTVLFCDLDLTVLSTGLDPEELREMLIAFRTACGDVVARYEGHVAQSSGDAVMVYFGWPRAHEDDAERGVNSALEMVDAVKRVTADRLLGVRIGVATGAVVVGQAGLVGETPNLAAQLQSLAGPDQIIIAPTTRRLVANAFELTDLGARPLKGILEPVQPWRVEAVHRTGGRFEAAHDGVAPTPLVGRDEEVAMLVHRWQQARGGEGQVVLVSGDPGIGKSRLTQALREQIADEPYTALRYQCSPYHLNSALYPIIEQIELAAGFTRDDTPDQKLDKMEAVMVGGVEQVAESAPLLAAALSLPTERYPPLNLSPQKQKEQTLDALVGQVDALASREPLLIVFEDAHWIDPTSQELLDVLVPRLPSLSVLLLITSRPDYTSRWAGQAHVAMVRLERLGHREAVELVANVARVGLPADVLDQIEARTDGVPLFIEELTKSVLESGLLRDVGGQFTLRSPLPLLPIPISLRDSLQARLDRLAPVKEIAQIGACIGREFSYELLVSISTLTKEQLEEALKHLVDDGLLYPRGTPPDATYTFKHALVRDAAYASLLRSKRQQLHAQIAQILEKDLADRGAKEPGLLAYQYTQSGNLLAAIALWRDAGNLAARSGALQEASGHLQKGLAQIAQLPSSSERDELELSIREALGAVGAAERKQLEERSEQDREPIFLATSIPRELKRGEVCISRFVAYVKALEQEVRERLELLANGDSHSHAIGFDATYSARWAIGTPVTVSLGGTHVRANPSEQTFEWNGKQNLLSFELRTLRNAPLGKTVIHFEARICDIPVAFIPLELEIRKASSQVHSLSVTTPARTAFASYACADRSRVMDQLSAVSAYDNALDVFTDCLDLKPGEEWKRRLAQEIPNRDLFFLFWSLAASRSKWVTWEWQTAKAVKGLAAIRPVPLDDPTDVPPPPELGALHFSSRYVWGRVARQNPLLRAFWINLFSRGRWS